MSRQVGTQRWDRDGTADDVASVFIIIKLKDPYPNPKRNYDFGFLCKQFFS